MRTFPPRCSKAASPSAFHPRGPVAHVVGGVGRILGVVAILVSSCFDVASATAPNGAGGGSQDPLIAINAGWSSTQAVPPAFFWGSGAAPFANLDEEGFPIPFTFSSATDTVLRITDDFCRGDQFKVFDAGIESSVVIGTTPSVPVVPCSGSGQDELGPAAAFLNPTYSSGSFRVPARSHAITIQVITNPFGGGRGYIRIDTPVTPVAFSDTYTTSVNTVLTVPAPGLLANDTFDQITSPATDQTTAVKVSGPFRGTAVVNPDGSFTYTPNTGFTGIDTFTYQLNSPFFPDAHPQATVSIKVNDPAAQTATVVTVNPTCDVTLNMTFQPATTDTFVIQPSDFFKHWSCRLFKTSVTPEVEVEPNSVHGRPGTTIQLDGVSGAGDLQFIPAGQSLSVNARGNLCQAFKITDGDYRAECTAENSIPRRLSTRMRQSGHEISEGAPPRSLGSWVD